MLTPSSIENFTKYVLGEIGTNHIFSILMSITILSGLYYAVSTLYKYRGKPKLPWMKMIAVLLLIGGMGYFVSATTHEIVRSGGGSYAASVIYHHEERLHEMIKDDPLYQEEPDFYLFLLGENIKKGLDYEKNRVIEEPEQLSLYHNALRRFLPKDWEGVDPFSDEYEPFTKDGIPYIEKK